VPPGLEPPPKHPVGDSPWFPIVAVLFIVLMLYGSCKLSRWINYRWDWDHGYKSQVEDTVRELVKPECLKVEPR
jgi:hypothetical protein